MCVSLCVCVWKKRTDRVRERERVGRDIRHVCVFLCVHVYTERKQDTGREIWWAGSMCVCVCVKCLFVCVSLL